MSNVIVVGGSLTGLASALALAGSGHRVVILERGAPPPDGPAGNVAQDWYRPLVPQAGHSHSFTSLGVKVLRERAPHVLDAAQDAGAVLLDLLAALPGGVTVEGRAPGDDELVALACRRTTLELVLYRIVRAMPGVEIRHGAKVEALVLDRCRRAVLGVIVDGGGTLPAEIVIDATGRRTQSRSWLGAEGIPVAADQSHPSGLRICSRFYRLRGREWPGPLNRGNGVGVASGDYIAVLHPGDGGAFSVGIGTPPGDDATQDLRMPAAFTALARVTPGVAPWLADGVADPISPVRVINSPPSMVRGLATPAQEPVTGLYAAGDAACVTNPLYGRGQALAIAHAFGLADLLAAHPKVDETQSHEAARFAESLFVPWYEQAVDDDRDRIALWAAATGDSAAPPVPSMPGRPSLRTAGAAAVADTVVWRGVTRMLMGLGTPAELFDDEKFRTRVREAPPFVPPQPLPPMREELVSIVRDACS
jgi:2-polyprenyl-6-methoxyphenol hydroxylase-like FAD-dependent oxidoreductase